MFALQNSIDDVMENENEFDEKPKKYKVARFYRNGNVQYDLFMNLSDKFKRISATKIRTIGEGVNTSEFAVITEDVEAQRYEAELWQGQKDSVSGVMNSKRVVDANIMPDIAHLFVSECSVNAFAIKNNSESVAIVVDRVLEFTKQQGKKIQKTLG